MFQLKFYNNKPSNVVLNSKPPPGNPGSVVSLLRQVDASSQPKQSDGGIKVCLSTEREVMGMAALPGDQSGCWKPNGRRVTTETQRCSCVGLMLYFYRPFDPAELNRRSTTY